jgi:hypothetical protein
MLKEGEDLIGAECAHVAKREHKLNLGKIILHEKEIKNKKMLSK